MPTKNALTCIATSLFYQGNEIEVRIKYDDQYFHTWFIWVKALHRAKPRTARLLRSKLLQLKLSISRLLLGGGEWQAEGSTEFGLIYHQTDDPEFGQAVVIKAIEGMPEIEWDGAWWIC